MKCPICGTAKEKFDIDIDLVKQLNKIPLKNREILIHMVVEAHQELKAPKETIQLFREIKNMLREELGETREDVFEKLDIIDKKLLVYEKSPAFKGQVLEDRTRTILRTVSDKVDEIGTTGTRATDIIATKDDISCLIECKSKKLPVSRTSSAYHHIIERFTEAMDERKTKYGMIITERLDQLPSKEPITVIKKGDRIILLTTIENEHLLVAYALLVEMARLMLQHHISLKTEILKEISSIFQELSELRAESHWFVEKAIEIEKKGTEFEDRFAKQIEYGKAKIGLLLGTSVQKVKQLDSKRR